MSTHAIPSLPALTLRLDFRYHNGICCACNQFYFQTTTPPGVGWSFRTLWNSAISWLALSGFNVDLPIDYVTFSHWAFFNDGAVTHSDGSPILNNIGPVFRYVDPALCVMYTRRSTAPGRSAVARLYGPSAPTVAYNQQYFTAPYISAYQLRAFRLALPFIDQGATYTPQMFCPKLNAFFPIVHYTAWNRPFYKYSRRPTRAPGHDYWTFPVVP